MLPCLLPLPRSCAGPDMVLYNVLMGRDLHDGRRLSGGEGRVGETRAARTLILGAIHQQQAR